MVRAVLNHFAEDGRVDLHNKCFVKVDGKKESDLSLAFNCFRKSCVCMRAGNL